MAITLGAPNVNSIGGRFKADTLVTLDNSYATGGYAVTAYQLGLPCGLVDSITATTGSTGYNLYYNAGTGKLQSFTTGGTETANATNLSAVTATVSAVGR